MQYLMIIILSCIPLFSIYSSELTRYEQFRNCKKSAEVTDESQRQENVESLSDSEAQSFHQKLLRLCQNAFEIDPELAAFYLHTPDIACHFKKQADEGDEASAYFYAHILTQTDGNQEEIRTYLLKAPREPLAHAYLIGHSKTIDEALIHYKALANMFDRLTRTQKEFAIHTAFDGLLPFFNQKSSAAFPFLIRLCLLSEDVSDLLRRFCEYVAKNNLRNHFHRMPRPLFCLLKTVASFDPDAAYHLGSFLWSAHTYVPDSQQISSQVNENQQRACELWTVVICTRDTNLQQGPLMPLLKNALAEAHMHRSPDNNHFYQMLNNALNILTASQYTSHIVQALGSLFVRGIPGLMAPDKARAMQIFKNAYAVNVSENGIEENSHAAYVSFITNALNALYVYPLEERLLHHQALVQILDEFFVRTGVLQAALTLIKVYAFGDYGIKPSPAGLKAVLKRMLEQPYTESLLSFLEQASLIKALTMQEHTSVHGLILALEQAALRKDRRHVNCTLKNIEQTIRISPTNLTRHECFYTSGLCKQLIVRARAIQDLRIVAYVFSHLLHDYSASFNEKSDTYSYHAQLHALLLEALICAESCLLEIAPSKGIALAAEPSMQDLLIGLRVILETNTITETSLRAQMWRLYAQLLIITAELMSDSFKKGVCIFEELIKSDQESKKLIEIQMTRIAQEAEQDAAQTKDAGRFLLCNFAAAFMARSVPNLKLLEECLEKNLSVIGAGDMKSYIHFSKTYDADAEFYALIKPEDKDGLLEKQFKIKLGLVLRYHNYAQSLGMADVPTKKKYDELSQERFSQVLAIDPLVTNMEHGVLYIKGILPPDLAVGARMMSEALLQCDRTKVTHDTIKLIGPLFTDTFCLLNLGMAEEDTNCAWHLLKEAWEQFEKDPAIAKFFQS